MRVLFFTHTFAPDYTGGAEVSLYHTCQGLRRRGVDCTVLTLSRKRPRREDTWYELDGIPVHRISLTSAVSSSWAELLDLRVVYQVWREIKHLRPDIFHIHNVFLAGMAPFVAAWAAGVPTICTLHDHWLLCPNNMLYQADGRACDPSRHADVCGRCHRGFVYWGAIPKRRQTLAWLTRAVDRFIAPSQALLDIHVAAGYAPQRFRHVQNALADPEDLPLQHPGVAAFIADALGHPSLVFAGGGTAIKGAHIVLEILPRLLDAIPGLRVAIAGGGDPALLQAFARHAPAVHVLGPVPFSDMRSLFAAADLTIVPSVCRETSSVVAIESFQVGTPVVASAIGGIPELIATGVTGYLVEPSNPDILRSQIVDYFQRPAAERRRMRQACIFTARREYTLERHLDGVESVYAEVIGPSARLAVREVGD